jgi:hypothetical protein
VRLSRCALALLLVPAVLTAFAEEKKPDQDDGFVPLFNGKDLTGWINVNCAPGTFYVKDGMIITTGQPIGFLRTEKQYENFIADFEWMHVPPKPDAVGNSGFFVWADPLPVVGSPFTRGVEVQVLVNLTYRDKKTGAVTASSHGDIFSIQGATCKPDRPHPTGGMRCIPSEDRAKGANEWNHYRVTANNGTIKLEVNGKEVSGVSDVKPHRKGYLALESEGSECRFRNLKIKELPSTNPKPDEVAPVDQGYRSWFTGLDLTGWQGARDDWKVGSGILRSVGKGNLTKRTDNPYYGVLFDWKVPAKAEGTYRVLVGDKEVKLTGKPGVWNRAKISASASPFAFTAAEGLEIRNVFKRHEK